MELLFGDGAALPFDLMAAKTGKDYWVPSEKGRKLLADEAANCSRHVGVNVDRETSPMLRLALAYVAVGIKPALMVMYERMEKLERKMEENDKGGPDAASPV